MTDGRYVKSPMSDYERFKKGQPSPSRGHGATFGIYLGADLLALAQSRAEERGIGVVALINRAIRAYLGVPLTEEERGQK